MGVSVVVGGQFGSEGKGKVVRHFAEKFGVIAGVKVSGTNAGHTSVDSKGETHIFRVLPSACTLLGVHAVISPGAYFQPDLLLEECEAVGFPKSMLHIHPQAGIITQEIENEEVSSDLRESIGSTKSGTGFATYHRVALDGKFVAAKDVAELAPYICDTTELMRSWLDKDEEIIIEGAQGFGLSLYHTPYYPYCTSRDTSASAYVGDSGLSPFDIDNIIQVLRSYPIRVAGNSGPLPKETSWKILSERIGRKVQEKTSVTKNTRRVGEFDPDIVQRATEVNRPNITVMNFMDYIPEWDDIPEGMLGPNRMAFLNYVERTTGCAITHVGFGADDVRTVEEASNYSRGWVV